MTLREFGFLGIGACAVWVIVGAVEVNPGVLFGGVLGLLGGALIIFSTSGVST